MKKILITGASGFIGRQCLTPLLERGFEVHALSKRSLPEYEKDVVWHCQDFLDEDETKKLVQTIKPSHCLHFAWYTEPGKYWTSHENLSWTASTISLIYSFYQHAGERFVGAGSCAEYDWRYGHCSEAITPLEPSTLYGNCKNALQKMLASFSENNSLSSAWGRIFFLYGPHERSERLVPSVIIPLLRDKEALCSHGNQIRDFMYVNDAAGAFMSLLESGITGTVNIASGAPISIRDIILKIADQLHKSDMIRFGALPTKKEDPPLLTADISRLKYSVGFSPKYDIESGLKQTIDWWKYTIKEHI